MLVLEHLSHVFAICCFELRLLKLPRNAAHTLAESSFQAGHVQMLTVLNDAAKVGIRKQQPVIL